MKLYTRCFPALELPYNDVITATRMMVKLYQSAPFLPILPKLEPEDSVKARTFNNIPGVKYYEKRFYLRTSTESYRTASKYLDEAYNGKNLEILEKYETEAIFQQKFFQIIKKITPAHAYINFLGPFSLLQSVASNNTEEMVLDKNFRKLFIQSVCVKVLWAISKIKEMSPNTIPIIIIEEPTLGQLGSIKRENAEITSEIIKNMLEKVINTIKEAGGISAIQCFEKCDWKIPIDAGADIISFDAYNNPGNLRIIPEKIIEFISRGGKINWSIIPVISETYVKNLRIDDVEKRLFATFEDLIISGVPEKFVYNSALISSHSNLSMLPIIYAEKLLIITTQLAKRIPYKK